MINGIALGQSLITSGRPVFQQKWGSISGGSLSSSDQVATQTTALTEMRVLSFSQVPKVGKWYAEVDTSDTNYVMAIGIGTALSSGSYAAARANASTAFISGGVTYATQATFTQGRIMLALDYAGGRVWVGRNSAWFSSGDPDNLANPYFSAMFGGDWYILVHGDNDGSGIASATLCTSAATQSYSPPAGFSRLS